MSVGSLVRGLPLGTLLSQLTGGTPASRKFEEPSPPTLTDFVYVGVSSYTATRLVQLEAEVLQCLGFVLAVPTVLHFLDEYLMRLPLPPQHPLRHVAYVCIHCLSPIVFSCRLLQLLGELSLLDLRLSTECVPSAVAAACVRQAMSVVLSAPDSDAGAELFGRCSAELAATSAYGEADAELVACSKRLTELVPTLRKSAVPRTPYHTLKLKYNSSDHGQVWKLVLASAKAVEEA